MSLRSVIRSRKISFDQIGLVLLFAILLGCASGVSAASLEVQYEFDRPEVKAVTIDGRTYDRVFLPDAPNTGLIGHPSLPAFGARILLPFGTEVESIEVVAGERLLVGAGFVIEPVDQPIPLSTPVQEIPPLHMESGVYALNRPVPEVRFVDVGIQTCRGYRIVVLKLNPTEYIPAAGELYYYPQLRVKITLAESVLPVPDLRAVPADLREVGTWIDNPSEFASYTSASRTAAAAYDMLIITLSTFADAFQPLKDYHDTTGVITEIHTLTQIGANDPHTVRDYIREQYQVNGIQYVLIGADDGIIPALDMYAVSFDRPDAPIEYQMPGDFYFSCLDGTFNYDGDTQWGEPGDGEGGGEIDLFPEVHVGRVSASSAAEVTNLVNKVLAYAASEEPYLEKVLLAGEQLGFGGMGEYGGYAMEEMVDGSDAHGFTTYGFPSAVYSFDKLYDYTDQPDYYWPPSEIISRINAGQHIVDHLGHSGPGYAMRTDTAMIRTQLTNSQYCFAYAEGCSAGTFDWTDCWAEYITVIMEHGAFACVANARLGLGSRSTAHPVHLMNREFWDAVYDAEEAKPQLGRAMSDTRADWAYLIDAPGMRWTIYETTLFGDPALAIKDVRSVAISFPDGVPDQVSPYGSVSFNVIVNGIGLGSPVAGSGELHYAIDGGEPVTVPMTEGPINQYEASLPVVPCGSSIEYYVSVQESGGERLYKPAAEEPFGAMSVSDELIIFEDDFETDKGWNISGGLWERGVPLGLGGDEIQYPVPDPTEGCNGPQVLGYNLSGDYENNLPQTPVTSPAIDCSGMENVHLRFCRWLGVERSIYDKASIWVSNNGATWTEVWANEERVVDLEWMNQDYDISAIADNQSMVYVRFNMGPTDPGLRFCGWNIDDVQLVSLSCRMCLVDSDGDGFGDPGHPENECPDDNCPGVYNPSQTDTDADGVGDLCDNCQTVANPSQEDLNLNAVGDACEGCCGFWGEAGTGNANCSDDGKMTLADVSRLIDHLFISKDALCCHASGNTNGSWDDGECKITLSDISVLIDALFISKEPTVGCMPECER